MALLEALPAADLAKARGMFGLPESEKLVSFYQCSVRAERNAIKEEHAHVGEMYTTQEDLHPPPPCPYPCTALTTSHPCVCARARAICRYVFEKHVCFDLKVFAFHKQLAVESREIEALLKADEKASSNTIDMQLKVRGPP